jgi:hypothetical protein
MIKMSVGLIHPLGGNVNILYIHSAKIAADLIIVFETEKLIQEKY